MANSRDPNISGAFRRPGLNNATSLTTQYGLGMLQAYFFGPDVSPAAQTDIYPTLTYAASRTTSSGTTFTPTLPSGTGRVFVPVSCPSNTTLTTSSTDWFSYKVVPNGAGLQCTWFVSRLSAGASPGALVVTSAASTLFSTVAFRSDRLRTRIVFGVSTIATAANANPGLVDQIAGRPTRFVEILTLNGTGVATFASNTYGNLQTQAGFTGGASTCVAEKSAYARTDDPGAWTHSSAAYITQTVALSDAGTDWDDEWVSASRNLAANGVNIAVNFWGDSLTAGATAASGGMAANQHATARPALFAANLTVGLGSSKTWLGVGGGAVTAGALNAYDSRRTANTGWDETRTGGLNTLGGGALSGATSGQTLDFTPGGTPDRFRVLRVAYSGSPEYTARWDSGSETSLLMNVGTSAVAWSSPITGTGTTIKLKSVGAGGYMLAAETYTSGVPQISVFNAGWFGSNSTQNAEIANYYSPPYVAQALRAKLTNICIGSNDPGSGVTTDQTEYNIQLMALVGLATGSVVIQTPPYASGGTEATQDASFDKIQGVADALCTGFLRISTQTGWTSYAIASAAGNMTAADNHPTTAGYADWSAYELAYIDPGPLPVALSPINAAHSHTATSPSLAQASVISPDSASHGHSATSPSLSASAGATNITPADAAHAHSATSPTLAAASTLSPANAAHAHTAGSPALAPNTTLAPADAAHAHSATSPSLAAKFTIAPANAAHAHTVSSPTLAAASTASVNNAAHAHSATPPTMAFKVTVAPDNASHAHTASSPTIVLAGTLSVSSALHAHAASSPALAFVTTVAPASAVHTHSATSPVLNFASSVSPNYALHDHAASSPAVTVTPVLAPDSALHTHSVTSPILALFRVPTPPGRIAYTTRGPGRTATAEAGGSRTASAQPAPRRIANARG